ncbi:hypothetical protein C8R43DRAFT_1195437 [Mycena crocata]|nr:hypothetical protein C8R43DRAFT_1195437 [Mycena crocata]
MDDLDVVPGIRHHHLLNSNEPPETSELTPIRALAAKTGAHLGSLEKEISFLLQNNTIISRLRKMPPEVLAEIFSWTLPSAGDALESGVLLDWKQAPWVLTPICTRWRRIALSTPSLWSLVVIDFQDQSFSSAYPLRTVIKTHIARAKQHKLRVHFYGDEEKDAGPQVEILRLLTEHSFRWEEFRIELTSFLVPVVATLRDRLPSLRRLVVSRGSAESQRAVESVIDCFENSPALVEASIYNQFSAASILLPIHQLNRYQRDGPWEMHRDILRLGSNLVQACIEIDFEFDSWPAPGEIIDLLHLRRLFCFQGTANPSVTTEILEAFPSLTELVMILVDLEDDLRGLALVANTLIIQLTTLKPGEQAVIAHNYPPSISDARGNPFRLYNLP